MDFCEKSFIGVGMSNFDKQQLTKVVIAQRIATSLVECN